MKTRLIIALLMVPLLTIITAKQSYAQTPAAPPKPEKYKPAKEREIKEIEIAERARERARFSTWSSTGSPHVISKDGYFFVNSGAQSSSQLSISKSYSGETKKNDGSFEVDKSTKNVSVRLNGNVEEGSITITILLPGGKEFKKLTIDDSANISFSQSLTIAEDETKYYGNWNYTIDARSAVGQYQLMIHTH